MHRDGVEILAIISEDDYKTRCAKHDVQYTFSDNQPLGRKKNHGLKVAFEKDWDYLMELNSDDLIHNGLLDIYDNLFGKHQFIGLRNFCFMDAKTKQMMQVNEEQMFGIGRCYSRKALDRAAFRGKVVEFWQDNASAGMDNRSARMMEAAKIPAYRLFTDKPLAVDIKSDVNIWKFNPKYGIPYKYEDFKKGLSDKEIECLERL